MNPLKFFIALLITVAFSPTALSAQGRGSAKGLPVLASADVVLSPGMPTSRGSAYHAARPAAPRHHFATPPALNPGSGGKALAFVLRSHAGPRDAFFAGAWTLGLPPPACAFFPAPSLSRLRAGWPRQWPIRPPPVPQSQV